MSLDPSDISTLSMLIKRATDAQFRVAVIDTVEKERRERVKRGAML